MIKLLATIALLATTPALAQGVTNSRDANGIRSRLQLEVAKRGRALGAHGRR
jgi:hypothetical protein